MPTLEINRKAEALPYTPNGLKDRMAPTIARITLAIRNAWNGVYVKLFLEAYAIAVPNEPASSSAATSHHCVGAIPSGIMTANTRKLMIRKGTLH